MTTIVVDPSASGELHGAIAPDEPLAPDHFVIPQAAALKHLGVSLDRRIGLAGTVQVAHPVQTRVLGELSRVELETFAETYGLIVVRRVGGHLFEFTRRAQP